VLFFQYLWFLIEAKMNFPCSGMLQVVRIVMEGDRGKDLVGNMRFKVYVAEGMVAELM
jgi:hypothetical protein